MPLVHGRLELVLPHCLDRLFVQAHTEMTNQLDVLRIPLRIDNEFDRDAALKVRSSSVFGKFRFDGMNDLWRRHSTTHVHQTAAVAAAAARASSVSVPPDKAAAKALAEA